MKKKIPKFRTIFVLLVAFLFLLGVSGGTAYSKGVEKSVLSSVIIDGLGHAEGVFLAHDAFGETGNAPVLGQGEASPARFKGDVLTLFSYTWNESGNYLNARAASPGHERPIAASMSVQDEFAYSKGNTTAVMAAMGRLGQMYTEQGVESLKFPFTISGVDNLDTRKDVLRGVMANYPGPAEIALSSYSQTIDNSAKDIAAAVMSPDRYGQQYGVYAKRGYDSLIFPYLAIVGGDRKGLVLKCPLDSRLAGGTRAKTQDNHYVDKGF